MVMPSGAQDFFLALMLLASAIGKFFNTVSTLATMSFVGIFFGVTEKFKPFSERFFMGR